MVGEFPELQGLMGGYYARVEGLPDAVADAIRDHYKPVGQGDAVPTAPVTVAVALADKLDTLVQFFAEDMRPTGSKDPFALRRAALGILQILVENRLHMHLFGWVDRILSIRLPYHDSRIVSHSVAEAVITFFIDRLKVQQRDAGVRHDLIDAVFAIGGEDDLLRLLDRVLALQFFVDTEDGKNLLAGYKRAANILKKETWQDLPQNYLAEPAEAALDTALRDAGPKVDAAIAAEDFTAAMAALASLRAPIDMFFEAVTVNDADANKRANRLGLLDQFRAAVHKVADFSRIEG
jgi:glycyl-tRNA synthetase beta chain